MKANYTNKLYNDYVELLEVVKKIELNERANKLENVILKNELANERKNVQRKINNAIEPYKKQVESLTETVKKAYEEIERLKKYIETIENAAIEDSQYKIDKLTNQVNKNSTNSSIPTSKENKHTRTNSYNHRVKSNKKSGGQDGHKGTTLKKEKVEEIISNNKDVEVIIIEHIVKGKQNQKDTVKYKLGLKTVMYVEKHVFKHDPNSEEELPTEFYSDVTYSEDFKSLIIMLGNYFNMPYAKICEFINDITNGTISISEGSISNFYKEFANKAKPTINNIIENIKNGSYTHTDETFTSQDGKETYFRGYANKLNVVYMYHNKKGDAPIIQDNIINNFFGTIISDHDVGIFKYGTKNQSCIFHLGRYFIEEEQNVLNIWWPMEMYRFLLKLETNRQILKKYGRKEFTVEEINLMEKEYDLIVDQAENQNELIPSTYWKGKSNTLRKRLIKNKEQFLQFIHDFEIPFDNNSMERLLRMIKSKTKVSGGFRSFEGGKNFGITMSIIKTSKLRKINPLNSIRNIFQSKNLFA